MVLPGEIDLYSGAQGDRYDEAYAFVRAGNVDGVVVMGGNINFQNRYADIVSLEGARALGVPIAVLGREVPGLPCAVMAAESGVREAIHHFVDHHGYRRIGFVKGREGHPHAEARFAAYREALAERGIPWSPDLVYSGNFSYTSGIRAAERMIGDGLERMDAVFACNDDLALGIVQVFPSALVIRNSCGCVTDLRIHFAEKPESRAAEMDKVADASWGSRAEGEPMGLIERLETRCGWLHDRVNQENRFGLGGLEAFSDLLLRFSMALVNRSDMENELEQLEMWLIRLVRAEDEMTMWEQYLAVLLQELVPVAATSGRSRAQGAMLHLHASIAEARGNKRRIERFRSNFTQSLRAESLLALAAVSSLDDLRIALEKQLPDLGVSRYMLALFVSPENQLERQICTTITPDARPPAGKPSGFPIERIPVDGFTGDEMPSFAQILFSMGLGMTPEQGGWREFPTLQLLPQGHRFSGDRLDVIVEPLFFGSEQYGYQVLELGPFGENLYDTFRPQIAAAFLWVFP